MAAVAHNPAFAKKVGISQAVGKEFVAADKGKKFKFGGRADLQKANKPKTDHGKSALFKEGGSMKESKAMMKKEVAFMKSKGAPKSMIKHEESEMKSKKYAMGGMPSQANVGGASRGLDRAAAMSGRAMPATGRPMKKGGVAASKMGKVVAGGKRPHGEHTVQQKGHTRGKQVVMKKGGKC